MDFSDDPFAIDDGPETVPPKPDPWDDPGWKRAAVDYARNRPPTSYVVEDAHGFWGKCEAADRERAKQRPPHSLPPNWHTLSLGALWHRLNDAQRRPTPQSVLDAAAWLVFQVKDQERWRAWLGGHTPAARADILAHIKKIEQRRAKQCQAPPT